MLRSEESEKDLVRSEQEDKESEKDLVRSEQEEGVSSHCSLLTYLHPKGISK